MEARLLRVSTVTQVAAAVVRAHGESLGPHCCSVASASWSQSTTAPSASHCSQTPAHFQSPLMLTPGRSLRDCERCSDSSWELKTESSRCTAAGGSEVASFAGVAEDIEAAAKSYSAGSKPTEEPSAMEVLSAYHTQSPAASPELLVLLHTDLSAVCLRAADAAVATSHGLPWLVT